MGVAVPWAVGEYLEYSVKFGILHAGSARMQVTGKDTLRGHSVWKVHFNITGGVPFLRVDDSIDSWMDVGTLNSLRFMQDLSEPRNRALRVYDIFPDRGIFTQNGKPDRPTVENPLDDASFFFFVRTIPLVVGQTYTFPRYFDATANPVIVKVLRKDTAEVAAGRFPSIVVQPIIKTGGVFSEGGQAEFWFTDDNRRILVQLKTRLSFGSLNLYLRKFSGTQAVIDSAQPRR